jgi:enamine deaminase RidA (YjgF/YER057c/UK114 family)
MPEPFSHYCHVVRADNHVYVSGAVGIGAERTAPADTFSQFELAFTKALIVACVMRALRLQTWSKSPPFMTDIWSASLMIHPLRQAYFGEHRPASTLVEAQGTGRSAPAR